MAGTTYTVNFQNKTDETWTMCVYQKIPGSPGLDSVAWKQTSVPRYGDSGVKWTIEYLACVTDYQQEGGKGVYKATQQVPTQLGEKWVCKFEDSVQQLFEDGTTTPGQLLIENESGKLANLAIGMDGNVALVKPNVYGGNNAQFKATPTYYIALFKDLTKGEVISGNQVHGPLIIKFEGGETTKNYIAEIKGQTFYFFDKNNPQDSVTAPLDEMRQRIADLAKQS